MANIQSKYKLLIILGYGIVTFAMLTLNTIIPPLVFKNTFIEKKWSIKKQLFWLTWILFSIGVGNYIYTALILKSMGSLYIFFIFQFYTVSIGIIPITILTILKNNQLLRENLKSASELNNEIIIKKDIIENSDFICLIAENEKDKLEISSLDLLFIESVGNYIEINYLKENKLQKLLMRSSLKRAESQLENCVEIVKCHRAFLVNSNNILQALGNSQGLKLNLKHTEIEIPVSRNYAKDLKDKLKN